MKENRGLESLIEATAVGQREHSDFRGRWCEYFTEDCITKMRDYGKSGNLCEHKCEYCDKFKWTVDRAKHYAEKTGMPYTDILKGWETDRDYWYLNYYQDCNQPEIKEGKVFVFETMEEYHSSLNGKGFRCPKCGAATKSPFECECNWKSYGFIRLNLVTVFVKENMAMANIFMPVAWEKQDHPTEKGGVKE